MRPMLATRGRTVPSGPGWIHEVKWDGMRMLVDVREGRMRLLSRTERDVSAGFPELTGLASAFDDLLLDGEAVALVDGRPSFGALAERIHVGKAARASALSVRVPVTMLVFDVLRLDGADLTGRPLEQRREVLESLGLADASWQVPPAYDDGSMLLDATREQGLEGIVSKRLSSRYHPGRRSEDWLKFAHRPTASYVVGGWRPETGTAGRRLGAVLVGVPGPYGLSYRGRVGSGLAGRAGQMLLDLLDPLTADDCPFAEEVPAVDADGTVWVRPEVVVDVASLGHTDGGRLRQPSYQGIRRDLTPDEVTDG